MGDGFFDIILFAMVAAFLVLRLRSVLGKRTGHERRRQDPLVKRDTADAAAKAASDNVLKMPDLRDDGEAEPDAAETPLAAGITEIKVHDANFAADDFLTGACAAFELIVTAFAAGDKSALKPLVSGEVLDNFAAAMRLREQAGEERQTTLVGIKSAEMIEAGMDGRDAVVTVKFVTDQIDVTRDGDGKVIAGDPEEIFAVTDIWTFQHNTRSRDPNWSLVATRSPN